MKLVVYDRTCPRLGRVWAAGARLYRALGWIDEARAIASWDELAIDRPIRELQYWGHGKWGSARAGNSVLDSSALSPAHRLHPRLEALRAHLLPGALVWFRTCETLGARPGHDFAERLASWLGARIAGHTFVIGYYQSGLHALAPGVRPDWPATEGLAAGSPDAPERARWSAPWAPHTVTALSRECRAAARA